MKLLLWVLTLGGAWHALAFSADKIDGYDTNRHIYPVIIGFWALWLICFS